jgi:phosphate starvation-inducible membrane PsiE
MADGEGGGTKVLRGLLIAMLVVATIVLVAVFWRQVGDAVAAVWGYVRDHVPEQNQQRVALAIYLVVALLLGVAFSKAGHFTAYGIAMGLTPLLWALFWEGFPPLGLSPTWTTRMGLTHLGPTEVVVWAVVAAAIITLVFVPLELREKYQRRKHQLADTD